MRGNRAIIEPEHLQITRWARALPHYTVEWERALKSLRCEPPIFLHGNYLGQIGLARILAGSKKLAARIKAMEG
ncbi:MAG: hypothetical protein HC902_08975 [Calothrix sp. SM1_5_4]|nr:hypothetical protein [Calothrix sp. SM1_5_4]